MLVTLHASRWGSETGCTMVLQMDYTGRACLKYFWQCQKTNILWLFTQNLLICSSLWLSVELPHVDFIVFVLSLLCLRPVSSEEVKLHRCGRSCDGRSPRSLPHRCLPHRDHHRSQGPATSFCWQSVRPSNNSCCRNMLVWLINDIIPYWGWLKPIREFREVLLIPVESAAAVRTLEQGGCRTRLRGGR